MQRFCQKNSLYLHDDSKSLWISLKKLLINKFCCLANNFQLINRSELVNKIK